MKLKYKWNNSKVEITLKKIYDKTIVRLQQDKFDILYADKFIEYIEDFLRSDIIYNYEVNKALESLDKIEGITFIKGNKIKIPAYIEGNVIYINPDLKSNMFLCKEEKERLYLYYALLYQNINFDNKSTRMLSTVYDNVLYGTVHQNTASRLVNSGWLLIKTYLAQRTAEQITYEVLDKKRQYYNYGEDRFDDEVLNPINVYSNMDFYRVFEKIMIMFGKTLSEIAPGLDYSESIINYYLMKKAMTTNFASDIVSQYVTQGKTFELYTILYKMGIIYNAKMSAIGSKTIPGIYINIADNNAAFNVISELTSKLICFEEKTDYPVIIPFKAISSKKIREKVISIL